MKCFLRDTSPRPRPISRPTLSYRASLQSKTVKQLGWYSPVSIFSKSELHNQNTKYKIQNTGVSYRHVIRCICNSTITPALYKSLSYSYSTILPPSYITKNFISPSTFPSFFSPKHFTEERDADRDAERRTVLGRHMDTLFNAKTTSFLNTRSQRSLTRDHNLQFLSNLLYASHHNSHSPLLPPGLPPILLIYVDIWRMCLQLIIDLYIDCFCSLIDRCLWILRWETRLLFVILMAILLSPLSMLIIVLVFHSSHFGYMLFRVVNCILCF